MVLSEVADLEVVVAVDLARLGLQRGVQHAEEGGLADAVGSEQRDAAAHLDLEGDVLEDGLVRALVGERHVGELQDRSVVLRVRYVRSRKYVDGLAGRDRELDRRLLVLHHAARASLSIHPAAVVGVDAAQTDSLRITRPIHIRHGAGSSTSFRPASSPDRPCSAWTRASESFRPNPPSSTPHNALVLPRSFAAAAAAARSDRGCPAASRRAPPASRPSSSDDPPWPS